MKNVTTGSCNCGAVKFAIQASVNDVYMCHCSICRKATGSGGIAVAIVNKSEFSWVSGQDFVRTWQKPQHDWQCSFCTQCGSPLPGRNDQQSLYVPASLIDTGKDELTVRHHFYVDSKAEWEAIGDNGMQHPQGFATSKT